MTGQIGIKVLENPGQAEIDVIFVHGLTGDREKTWTAKGSDVPWIKALLPSDIPQARIMTFGYDADVAKALSTASSNNLRDHGKSLAAKLAMERIRSSTNDRPLIMVAHSLGGLVCEQALVIARGSTETHVSALLESTVGIIFLGTPHVGSDLAIWGKLLTRMFKTIRKSNSEIMGVLAPGSEMLANLQQEFFAMLELRRQNGSGNINMYCFYEEISFPAVGLVVPKHSAILSAFPNESIHANHVQMTKFSNVDDPGYQAVSGQLWLWLQQTLQRRKEGDMSAEELRAKRCAKFSEEDADQDRIGITIYSGQVHTGGGPVVQGDQRAARDINIRYA